VFKISRFLSLDIHSIFWLFLTVRIAVEIYVRIDVGIAMRIAVAY
jgi:hypothetical protein